MYQSRESGGSHRTLRFAGLLPAVWRQWDFLVLCLLGLSLTLPRLATLPIVGEEPRRAEVAKEMIATGDWVVPRQQGRIYCTRPPLQNWAIALVGKVRGQIDPIAIRLPSALATFSMALVCYLYGRSFLSPLGAFAAGTALLTMGQVLQIGTMGETDPLFAALLSAAILLWHFGYYERRWPQAVTWTVPALLAGLAALTKGIQAPVYFFAVVGGYLVLRRDWRTLFGWPMLLAAAVLAATVCAWSVPYCLAAGWQHTREIWIGQVEQRITHHGLAKHLITHPVETFACMLPWSPMLLAFCYQSFRRAIAPVSQHVTFLVTALVVTYPSVWFVPKAANRYYLPMYPVAALLIGLAVQYTAEQCSVATLRRAWRRFMGGLAVAIAAGGVFVLAVSLGGRWWPQPSLAPLVQPLELALAFAAASAVAAIILVIAWYSLHPRWSLVAVAAASATIGLAYRGVVVNAQLAVANDIRPAIAQLKRRLPQDVQLVSFGPVFHRFRYYWGPPIRLLSPPETPQQVPPGIEYFCIQGYLQPSRNDQSPSSSRRSSLLDDVAVAKLPFPWEPIGAVRCGRNRNDDPQPVVVIGRIAVAAQVAQKRSSGLKKQ